MIRPPFRAQRGFTLVEIAVVLVIIAVFLTMGAVLFRGVAAAQKRSITASRMAAVDAAFAQYVQLNKRLPCPADGRIASGTAGAGVEVRDAGGLCNGTSVNQQHGVVPWTTLGITETDATDGWDRRLTYRVVDDLVENPVVGVGAAMDMSWCDPAGTGTAVGELCNPACTNAALGSCTPPMAFLNAGSGLVKGLAIRNVAGIAIMAAP